MVEKAPQTNRPARQWHGGFTLIEMLVVVAIIVVVTSTVLSNNAKFGGTILLQNLAYDIALSTREAQIYGLSVSRFKTGGTTVFTAPFGVHFDLTSNKTYTVFADAVAPNGHYDAGELLQSTAITRGFYIGDLCVTPGSGAEDCTSPAMLDIVYKHPEPDAYIYICTNSTTCSATQYARARIVIMSPRGDSTNICIDLNGQVSVRAGSSCLY